MEGWEIRRRTARFRGIPLVVLSSRRTGGRRLDVHEFSKRDIPYAEDLGRSARGFVIEGLVIGPDHDLDAERLEIAFEQSGPGELVLPHRAPIQVAVRTYTFEEPDQTARMQRFEVEFVEAGLAAAPRARENTAGIAEQRADSAFAALADRFASVFSLDDQTAAQIDHMIEITSSAASQVESVFDKATAGHPALEEIAAAAREIDAFKRRMAGSIVDAAVVAADLQDRLDDLLSLPLAPLNVYRRLAEAVQFGVNLADPGQETSSRKSFKRNQDAFVALTQHSVTTARAKALSRATFESSTEAAEYRDEIAAELAAAIVAASDAFADGAVAGLRALRTATIRDLDQRGARLPARVTWTVPYPLPAIVIAQRLYGDPDREAEIVTRNRRLFRTPGRIPYGTQLEVLADG